MNIALVPANMRACVAMSVPPDAPARWAELAERASEANAFYHPALLRPALEHLDRACEVRPLEVYEGDLLIGLMPVVPNAVHGRYPVSNVSNWMHPHCFYGAPLLRAGYEEKAWEGFLAQLDGAPWAGSFLHLHAQHSDGPGVAALHRLCRAQQRKILCIDSYERALLHSPLMADEYWQTHVRAKKRKELRRLVNRLEESGKIVHRRLTDEKDIAKWGDDFIALEASGWKGEAGTAIASNARISACFRESLANAFAADMLDMLRIDADGRAIAMLVNFRCLDGAFSYKIAIDENFARYSPGVLIEIDNLHAVLGDPSIQWMDSCAMPGHPMIDSLWAQRRSISQYRIALKGQGLVGMTRTAAFALTGFVERMVRSLKGQGNS